MKHTAKKLAIVLLLNIVWYAPARAQLVQGRSTIEGKAIQVQVKIGTQIKSSELQHAEVSTPYLTDIGEKRMLSLRTASLSLMPYEGGGIPMTDKNKQVEENTLGATTGTNFGGIGYTGYRPPDPVVAVGESQIVQAVNLTWRITDKSGNLLYSDLLSNFFATVPGGVPANLTDPKLAYDPGSQRFILLVLGYDTTNQTSSYLIAVSQTSSAIGSWWAYKLNARLNGNTDTPYWADFPGLGFDGSAIYISSNQYTFTTPHTFQYAKLRILNKSTLYSGGNIVWYDFWNWTNSDGSPVFTWKPMETYGSAPAEYLINTESSGWSNLTLWAVTNPLSSSPTLTRQATISIGSYSVPPNACQLGGTNPIVVGDCRTQDGAWRNGYLYSGFTVGYNWGSGTVAAIRLLKINTNTNSAEQNTTFGLDGYNYFYPAAFVNASGVMFAVFNRSSCSEYVNIRAVTEVWNDPSSTLIKSGDGYYSQNRWGDYSGIGLDPSGPIWVTGEYPTSTSTNWATWIASLTSSTSTVQVTVQTNPLDRIFTVDGTNYSTTQTFNWVSGSSHTIATTTSQSGGAGTQYTWNNWSDGGAISHTVSPTSNTTYTANFLTQYYLTMNLNPAGSGSLNISSNWYLSGDRIDIRATPNSGYTFLNWVGSGTGSYSGTNNPSNITMNSPITETANLQTVQNYIVTVTANPSNGGSVSGGGTFASGTQVTVTATPNSGYSFVNWTENGNQVSTSAGYTFSITGNRNLTANFQQIQQNYTVTVTASPSSGGSVSGGGTFTSGTQVTVTATPNSGYNFINWTENGSQVSTSANYIFR